MIALTVMVFMLGKDEKISKVLPYIICFEGLFLIFTIASDMSLRRTINALAKDAKSDRAFVAEGIVTEFIPMPAAGHKRERFCVSGECSGYSDSAITGAFNQTSSHGGPIRFGLQVRVTYVLDKIVKLEIAT